MPHLDTIQPYPLNGYPLSSAELRKSQLRNPMSQFLKMLASRDVVLYRDDFIGKALDATNLYTIAAGASATTFAQGALEDGTIRGTIGTTAATSALQFTMPNVAFAGARNYGCEVRWKSDVVTELRAEIGFVDAIPAVNTNLVNSLVTPSYNTVAKGVLSVWDNATAVNTGGLYAIGSGVAANKTAGTTTPTAATYQTVRIQVNGTKAALWIDGLLIAQPTADATTAADLVKFVACFKGSDTNAKVIDIDYIAVWKDRAN